MFLSRNNAICCLMLLLAPCKTATQGYLHHYCSVFLEPSTARAAQRAGEGRATVLWPGTLGGKGHLHTSLLILTNHGSAWSRGSLTEFSAFCNLHHLDSSEHKTHTLCHLCISMEFHCGLLSPTESLSLPPWTLKYGYKSDESGVRSLKIGIKQDYWTRYFYFVLI